METQNDTELSKTTPDQDSSCLQARREVQIERDGPQRTGSGKIYDAYDTFGRTGLVSNHFIIKIYYKEE
jgi:hypothetical protein